MLKQLSVPLFSHASTILVFQHVSPCPSFCLPMNVSNCSWVQDPLGGIQSRRHLLAIPCYGREKGLACLLQQWKEFTGMLEKSQISLTNTTACIGVHDVKIDIAYASQLHSFLFLNKIYFSSKTTILKQTQAP